MKKRLTLMEMYEIRKDIEAGLTDKEISELRGIERRTVCNVRNGKTGKNQEQKADRMEYFSAGKAAETGNYRKNKNGHTEKELIIYSPVLEEILMEEELELRLKEES